MTQAMVVQAPGALTASALPSYTEEQVALIKRTVCEGSTDDELQLFLWNAKRMRLDPFARQIYSMKRWDSEANGWKRITHVSIDGLRLTAERTGDYLPSPKLPEFEYTPDGTLYACTVEVLKWKRDQWHPVPVRLLFSEYAQFKRDGKLTSMWATKGHSQLAKCCEAAAIRKGFPNDTSGVYIPEEFNDEPAADAPAEQRPTAPPPPPAPAPAAAKAPPAAAKTRPQAPREPAQSAQAPSTPPPAAKQGDPPPAQRDLDAILGPTPAAGPKSGEIDQRAAGEFMQRPIADSAPPMKTSEQSPTATGETAPPADIETRHAAALRASTTQAELDAAANAVAADQRAGKVDRAMSDRLVVVYKEAQTRIYGGKQ